MYQKFLSIDQTLQFKNLEKYEFKNEFNKPFD